LDLKERRERKLPPFFYIAAKIEERPLAAKTALGCKLLVDWRGRGAKRI